MKKYFAYIRVSTTKQGEQGSSLQEQRSAIEAYATRQNLKITTWFEEQETAANQGRPIFGKMLRLIEQQRADGVITHKIDRSARNLRDWARVGELIDRGVEMHFAHESIDLTSRGGRLSADILAVVASDYIRNLRDEVRKGFYGRLKQGLLPMAAPLGYLDQGGGKPKIIDPLRGPLIKQAFELYATGLWSLHTLRAELHTRGLRNRRGGRVTINGLSTILNNAFYFGLIVLKRTKEVFEGVHEPLIEPQLFARVADILAGRTPKRGPRTSYRYQRMLRCRHCDYSLTAERQKGHIYYRCHTQQCLGACLREEGIESAILSAAKRLCFTPEQWAAMRNDVEQIINRVSASAPSAREIIVRQITSADERLARTTDAYIENMIDKATFSERKERLLNERLKLRAAMHAAERGNLSAQGYVHRFFELGESLGSFTNGELDENIRAMFEKATSNLTASGKDVEIHWRSPIQEILAQPPFLYGEPDDRELRMSEIVKIVSNQAVELLKQNRDHSSEGDQSLASPAPDEEEDWWSDAA